MTRPSDAEFVRAHEAAESTQAAAQALGLSVTQVRTKAGRLRKLGVKLKRFPRGGSSSRTDVAGLNRLLGELRGNEAPAERKTAPEKRRRPAAERKAPQPEPAPPKPRPVPDLPESDGEQLRRYREALHASQRSLAKKLGLTQMAISRMERGQIPVPDYLLPKVKSLLTRRVCGSET